MNSFNVRDLIISALMTSLICVGAFIKIPLFVVPVTMQFFFVNFSIVYQSRKYAALTILTYIILGLIGLPVFSGGGGPSYIFMPTFGYIIGFFLASVVSGTVKRYLGESLKSNLLLSLINIFIIYFCGVFYFYFLSNFYLGNQIEILRLLVVGCLIFIPSDTISGILSSLLSVRIKKCLK